MSNEQSATPREVSEQAIAVRAYAKWQQRGCPLGNNAVDDWDVARAELERELSLAALRQPTPCITPTIEANDNLHLQLRNLVRILVDGTPRPAGRQTVARQQVL